jgi:hypothetical protein
MSMTQTSINAVEGLFYSVRKDFSWRGKHNHARCFACGVADLATHNCKCGFSKFFKCANQNICAKCEDSMLAVGVHVRRLFDAPVVDRSNSRKRRRWVNLNDAAEEMAEKDERFEWFSRDISRAAIPVYENARESEPDFRRELLAAFDGFLDWQLLAAELKVQNHNEIARAIIKSGILKSGIFGNLK